MNAYYENTAFNKNPARENIFPQSQFGDKFITFICNVVAIFTCESAVKIQKTLLSTVLLIASFGVVGGMESGEISMLWGLMLCSVISFTQYKIFKSMLKKHSKVKG